ncbi:serine/arginine-rich splicing factor 3 isoform X1 [Gallus gallus]|uniref:serine/arginine-rich splicing factor 3 isoform X1 n=1 Tax=Gallus gallus TaxID=9031 RepID=UPI001F00389C|nr:serine/arginine-rich splicing factor 3 isoform X1 [Gallus gallus]
MEDSCWWKCNQCQPLFPEPSVGVVSELSSPMVKNGVGTVAHLPPGAGALEMTTAEGVLLLAADHREGEAFLVAAAGPSPETEEERDHSHGRGTISLLVPFPGLAVAPGQMRGNKTLRRSCVQEVVRSEYGEYVQNIVLFWNFIKLGAFLKCFSC